MRTFDSVVYKGLHTASCFLESNSITSGFYFVKYLSPIWWVGERKEREQKPK